MKSTDTIIRVTMSSICSSDLALLQKGMLKGEALSKFIKRDVEML